MADTPSQTKESVSLRRDQGDHLRTFADKIEAHKLRIAFFIATIIPCLIFPLTGCNPLEVQAADTAASHTLTAPTPEVFVSGKFARLETPTLLATVSRPTLTINPGTPTPEITPDSATFCQENIKLRDYWPRIEKDQILDYCQRGIEMIRSYGVSWEIIRARLTDTPFRRSSGNFYFPFERQVELAFPAAVVHEYTGHGIANWGGDPQVTFKSADGNISATEDKLASVISESFAEEVYRDVFSWDNSVETISCGTDKGFNYREGARSLASLEKTKLQGLWREMANSYDSSVRRSADPHYQPRVKELFAWLSSHYHVSEQEVTELFLIIFKASCR